MSVAEPIIRRQADVVAAMLEAEIPPFVLGALDAEKGEACQPDHYYFGHESESAEYVAGYREAERALAAKCGAHAVSYRRGICDFEQGVSFDPYGLHGSRAAREAYTLGRGEAANRMHVSVSKLVEVEYEAELADYEEDMLDREFWSRGSW